MPGSRFLYERGKYMARQAAQAAGMSRDLERYQPAARVFLARLPILNGPDAPHVLRRIADELEWLEEDAQREEQERVSL